MFNGERGRGIFCHAKALFRLFDPTEIAYNFADPTYGWECARDIVNQHPYNFAAWNCYYKVISKYSTPLPCSFHFFLSFF